MVKKPTLGNVGYEVVLAMLALLLPMFVATATLADKAFFVIAFAALHRIAHFVLGLKKIGWNEY